MATNLDKGRVGLLRSGREWLLLLLSFLVAIFIWLIHNLSLSYPVFLQYNVEARSNIPGRAQSSFSDDILIIRATTDGFSILRHRMKSKPMLTISVDPKHFYLVSQDADIFYTIPDEIKGEIIEAVGKSVDLEFIMTDTLHFAFPRVSSKKVPVYPNYSASCKSQYMQVGPIMFRPDSVIIYGEEKILAKMDSVLTKSLSLNQIDRPAQGLVDLISPRGIKLSENKVYYSLDIQRYVEESVISKVSAINVPKDKELMLVPSQVTVTFRRAYSSQVRYTGGDFEFIVDFEDFQKSIDAKIIPIPHTIPDGVFSVSIEPKYIDCLLINH